MCCVTSVIQSITCIKCCLPCFINCEENIYLLLRVDFNEHTFHLSLEVLKMAPNGILSQMLFADTWNTRYCLALGGGGNAASSTCLKTNYLFWNLYLNIGLIDILIGAQFNSIYKTMTLNNCCLNAIETVQECKPQYILNTCYKLSNQTVDERVGFCFITFPFLKNIRDTNKGSNLGWDE